MKSTMHFKQFQPLFLFSYRNFNSSQVAFPFAQAVCTESRVSSFGAIWRPRSFIFTRGTTISPELTCIVPDFPDVSVQIPQSCVPVDQDFCVTIQVHETI